MPVAPYPKTVEPYFSVAIQIDERYHHKLSCQPTSLDLCTVCPQAGKIPCPGCRLVQYCSEKCLEKDRPIHELFCKSFELVSAGKRPIALDICFFRAIFIPENGKPRWTWVKTTSDRLFYCLEHLYSELPSLGLTQHSQSIQLGYHSTRVPKHGLIATARNQQSRGEEKSSVNKFLQSQGPPGHLDTHWGPFIVLAFKAGDPAKRTDPRDLFGLVEDVEMADVAHIFHTLTHNLDENPCVVDIVRYAHKTIPAVKINGLGDRRRFHPDKDTNSDAAIYEVVTVPNKACDRSIQWPSIFAFTLGLPWVCRRVYYSKDHWVKAGPKDKGEWAEDGDSLTNPELGCLHAVFKAPGRFEAWRPRGEQLVPAGVSWDDNMGTVLILHMYGEPIPVEHIKMFQLFCKETDVMNLGGKPKQAIKVFHRAAFREFWDAKKKENAIPGMDLAGIPSPYAWKDKPRKEDNYIEDSEERAEYEKLFKQAEKPVVFGYIPQDRPIFMSMASLLLDQEFERWSGNNFWQR
ncbi:mynd finger family protein [Diaporthe eres]|uniref:MYND-type domain-containing protein n=1 Tax=Diaporthe vaccinii TaxID=105482 RepID=A0ABR4E887_9PEZI|nr:mynd finger family protein [Diaporthe eres]